MRLRIRNSSASPRTLSAFYYVDWCLSDTRSRSIPHIVTSIDTVCGALFARNAFRPLFGGRVAFVDTTAQTPDDDRRSLELHRPKRNAGRSARDGVYAPAGPCRRDARSVRRRPGEADGAGTARQSKSTFMLGEGSGRSGCPCAGRKIPRARRRRRGTRTRDELWDTRLSAVEVETPDAALNMLTQQMAAVSDVELPFSRPFGVLPVRRSVRLPRSAAGCAGVSAFRRRTIARDHIIRAAGRQFAEGRCAALVARAGRRRGSHAHPGRSSVARVRGAGICARDGRSGHLRRDGADSSSSGHRGRTSTACTRRRRVCR